MESSRYSFYIEQHLLPGWLSQEENNSCTMDITLEQLTVTLVEPSVAQQKIIARYLNNQGVRDITCFDNADQALVQIRETQPDLVISALYLPDLTGTDLLHTLRSSPDTQNIVFMLISSETRFQALDPVRQAGAVAILPKPFAEEQLRAALYSTIELLDPSELVLDNFDSQDLKVLIVDDSGMARRHVMRVLNSMGIEDITEVTDGIEAVPVLESNLFDLVITDYNMPEMDGEKLVSHIRNKSMQSSVPVLMVTSEEDEVRLAAARQSGVSALSDKPFEPENIRRLITRLLSE